jgi:hypothetical protein
MIRSVGRITAALDLGSRVMTPSSGALAGTVAILEIGPDRLTLRSDTPPASPSVFTWDAATLTMDLGQSLVETIGVGVWPSCIFIERQDGTRLHTPATMTEIIEIMPWG